MLNGTLCATERALCCLVENYQTPDVRLAFLPSPVHKLTSTRRNTGYHHPRTPPPVYAEPRVHPLHEGALLSPSLFFEQR